ncbi:MAG: hypothetical protein JRF72_03060 [Deltaproteobacteria bacterium]|jgi:2-keto-4-pentenoate hydratase|nr:hypothetical protein [Deltaproteobacteria bacterium]
MMKPKMIKALAEALFVEHKAAKPYHPFEAVAWLANLLNRQGKMLQRDMLGMTGSSIKTKFPHAGDILYFQIEGMGGVRLEMTN